VMTVVLICRRSCTMQAATGALSSGVRDGR
jgi:hypothetical protein